jgi:Smg protein|tara:strand:- start:162 stop:602 length:441 start_codon:yes stop_codon:yes gene_type:complete
MFENYLSSQNQLDFNNMTQELEAAGFDNDEIQKAFDWFAQLKLMADKIPLNSELEANDKLRIFTESELEKIACDGLGFILFLEQAKVLNSIEREIIIDRAMALSHNIISIDEVRWIVMMALWNNGRENDYLFVEDALYQKENLSLH